MHRPPALGRRELRQPRPRRPDAGPRQGALKRGRARDSARVHRDVLGYSLLFKTAVVDLLGTHADFTSNRMLCTLLQGVLAETRGVKKIRTAFINVCLHSKPLYDVFQTPWEITCLSV